MPDASASPTAAPSPTTVPTPAPSSLLPSVYYQDGRRVYAVAPDGSGRVLVATLPVSTTIRPQLLPDGRLLYPASAGPNGPTFATVDRYGRVSGIRTPDLDNGESVWSVSSSPDSHFLAWQIYAPLQLPHESLNTGVGRIVLTGRFGGAGTTIFTTHADSTYGATQVLVGWRPSSQYGTGDQTLLLQNLYGASDAAAGVIPNEQRGLIEYDPSIDDVIDDYLPALNSEVSPQRTFTVSSDGTWAIYGDTNKFTPSGEGPLAAQLMALDLNTNKTVELDTASNYSDQGPLITTKRHKVGKRVVTTHVRTGTLRLYQYFSHNASVAPDDGHVLYTLLTVSYPPGARVPQIQRTTLVATMDGRTRTTVSKDAQGQGWLDSHTVVIARSNGLYSVDIDSNTTTKLAAGSAGNLYYIGMRTK